MKRLTGLALIVLAGVVATVPATAAKPNRGYLCDNPTIKADNSGDPQTIHGTSGRDVIAGGHGPDKIYGHAGNDKICGNKGRDLIYGNRGDDRVRGFRGNDLLYGNRGHDRANGGFGNTDLCRAERKRRCER